jgi:DNA invertase Pin-like site-specific DNA recombinase
VATSAARASLRVGIYARISSDRDGDQLGVRRQIADCERLAERRGWVVADRYVDDDISAWSGKRRPQYERLLADLRSGAIGGVLVYHLDRLTRSDLRELESFVDLCDRQRAALDCVTGPVDLSTATGRLTARMLGSLARYESDHRSERIVRKHEEIAAAGGVSGGGSRPYGYEADKVTVRPAEAAVVKECARRFLAGESLRSIASDLNRRGVPTAGGGEWQSQSLRRMLKSARISGQREHKGEIVSAAVWPAIITPEETTQIRARLAEPERRTNKAVRRYVLAGILICGQCGEKLVARPRAGGERRYACATGPGFSGCGKTFVTAEPVEAFVTEAVLHRVDAPEVAAAVEQRPANPDLQRWYEQLDADKQQLEELAQAYGRREFSMAEWRAAREPIEQRLTAARKELARATRSSALDQYVGRGKQLRADWGELDLSQQHAIIAAVVDRVEVGPGRRGYNRFDESRLTPFWRP